MAGLIYSGTVGKDSEKSDFLRLSRRHPGLSQSMNLGSLSRQVTHVVEEFLRHYLIVTAYLGILLPELLNPGIALLGTDVRGRTTM